MAEIHQLHPEFNRKVLMEILNMEPVKEETPPVQEAVSQPIQAPTPAPAPPPSPHSNLTPEALWRASLGLPPPSRFDEVLWKINKFTIGLTAIIFLLPLTVALAWFTGFVFWQMIKLAIYGYPG